MPFDQGKFRFRTRINVRHYELDWQGIVHNAIYLYYFETGRVEYLRRLGVEISKEAIREKSRIVVVRNEIDYLSPAGFGDELDVLTRISYVRNSSFAFEGILQSAATGARLAENVAIHVWLDAHSGRPVTVENWLRDAMLAYEGKNLVISRPRGRSDPE